MFSFHQIRELLKLFIFGHHKKTKTEKITISFSYNTETRVNFSLDRFHESGLIGSPDPGPIWGCSIAPQNNFQRLDFGLLFLKRLFANLEGHYIIDKIDCTTVCTGIISVQINGCMLPFFTVTTGVHLFKVSCRSRISTL